MKYAGERAYNPNLDSWVLYPRSVVIVALFCASPMALAIAATFFPITTVMAFAAFTGLLILP